MFKEFLMVTCLFAICYSAAIKDLQPEIKSTVTENRIKEPSDIESSDLEVAEWKHFGSRGFGGGYGGYGGYGGGYGGYGGYGGGGYGRYGGYGGGCGCGGAGYGHHHYHHKFYGK